MRLAVRVVSVICCFTVATTIAGGPGTPAPPQAPATQAAPAAEGTHDVTFFGDHANGDRIVFICDATGSMMQGFDLLRVELRKSIDNLKEVQSFNIIFFQGNAKPALFAKPQPATNANKQAAFEYIDTYACRGPTDPLPAIDAALRMTPDLIYFLIDPSDLPDQLEVQVLKHFEKTNAGRPNKVPVHALAFLDHNVEDEKFLKRLGTETGGNFRHVGEKDLNEQPPVDAKK